MTNASASNAPHDVVLKRPRVLLAARMLAFMRPVRGLAAVTVLIVLARVGAEFATLWFLGPAISILVKSGAHGSELPRALGKIVCANIALAATAYLKSVWEVKFSMAAVYHLRAAVYDRLQRVELSFHDRHSSSQLVNRAIVDLQAVRQFLNTSLISAVDVLFSLIIYITLLLIRSPSLIVAVSIPLLLCWKLISVTGRASPKLYRRLQLSSEGLLGVLSDHLYGLKVVRSFGKEQEESEKYAQANRVFSSSVLSLSKLQARLQPGIKAVASVGHIAIFIMSCVLVRQGRLEIGDLLVLGIIMGTLLAKLQQLGGVVEIYQKATASAQRLFDVLDAPLAAHHDEPAMTVARPIEDVGQIDFKRVTFGYSPEVPVLHDVSLRIPGGRTTAIVGPTGSGKSTLSMLIARFYEPNTGEIRIDENPLRHFKLADLRRTVGYVFQETFLFSESIADNIAYGRPGISREMIREACIAAKAHEFMEKLPQGYDTRLGEGGVQLSGGQRQRLALARALVYDPPVLVLDDATAALDANTERALYSNPAVFQRMATSERRTVIVIAHRLSVVQCAEHVVMMEEGRVVRSGPVAQILESDHPYLNLIRRQSVPEGVVFE